MTIAVIGLMILALAAAVAYPFVSVPVRVPATDRSDSRDALEREKTIAFMAIREAELDRAMGKLTDDDYNALRTQYEERALHALTAIDALSSGGVSRADAAVTAPAARYCVACGRPFAGQDDRFCAACGRARSSMS